MILDYEEFCVQLKSRVQKTTPNRSGRWKRYFSADYSDLEDYGARICYALLRNQAGDSEAVSQITAKMDDDVIWFWEYFIKEQIAMIRSAGDNEALILGLVAVAIVGPRSDPRDISGWVWELYRVGKIANVENIGSYFKQVGALASPKKMGSSIGSTSVSGQITDCPEQYEKWDARPKKRREDVSNRSDASTGFTPLMNAALKGNLASIFLLLHEGADIDATVDGISALALAAFAIQEDAVLMLINSGARTDVRPRGMSLLEFAALGQNNDRIMELLRRAGAK